MPKLLYNTIELEVPSGWIDMSVLTLVAPQATRFRANLVVSRDLLDGATIEAYARLRRRSFESSFEDTSSTGRNRSRSARVMAGSSSSRFSHPKT